MTPGLGRFADPGVHALDGVRGVNHLAHIGVETQERHELGPGVLPQAHNGRVLGLPPPGEIGQVELGGWPDLAFRYLGEDGEITWPRGDARAELSRLPVGRRIAAPPVLFRKIEDADVEAWAERFGGG